MAMSSFKVLVVHDEQSTRLAIAQGLEYFDCSIDFASNAKEAIQNLKEQIFELVLFDLDVSGLEGLNSLRTIVELRPAINIILMSTSATNQDIIRAMQLGAADFLRKPFTPQTLHEVIGRVRQETGAGKLFEDSLRPQSYDESYASSQQLGADGHIFRAIACVIRTIKLDPFRPEGFNLLGELEEMLGDTLQGQKYYRVALALDPAYVPAQDNLHRTVQQPLASPLNRPNLAE